MKMSLLKKFVIIPHLKRTFVFTLVLAMMISLIPPVSALSPVFDSIVNVTDCSNTDLCDHPAEGQIAVYGNNVHVLFSGQAPCSDPNFCFGGGIDSAEVLMVSSTDGGKTFGSPKNLSDSLLNENIFGFNIGPADREVAAFGNNVIGVWESQDAMLDDAIFARVSNDAGATFGNRIIIQDFGGVEPHHPTVTASSSGFFLAYDEDVVLPGIIARRDSSFTGAFACQRLAGELEDDCSSNLFACKNPQVVASGSNVYVGWTKGVNIEGDRGDLLIRVSNDGGVLFNPKINMSNIITDLERVDDYRIVADGNNVYVIWHEFVTDNINLRISNDAGANFGSVIPFGVGRGPTLAVSGSNVYVSFDDFSKIQFRTSTNGGTIFGPEVEIGGSLFSPLCATVGTVVNTVFVVYSDNVSGGSGGIDFRYSEDNGQTFSSEISSLGTSDIYDDLFSFCKAGVATEGNKIFVLMFSRSSEGGVGFDFQEVILRVAVLTTPDCPDLSQSENKVISSSCTLNSSVTAPENIIVENEETTETKTETVEKSDSTEKVEESTKPEVEESKNEEAKSS